MKTLLTACAALLVTASISALDTGRTMPPAEEGYTANFQDTTKKDKKKKDTTKRDTSYVMYRR